MLRWFSKKKTETSKSLTKPKSEGQLRVKKRSALPRNFAEKVVNLELQCERPDVTRE